jgi:CPA2 family monovalent cation:H+ antiporter-2
VVVAAADAEGPLTGADETAARVERERGRIARVDAEQQAARTRRSELFLAAALVVLIGSAATAALAGMSPAVGALMAGLMLSTSDYRRQIEAAVQPFEGLLLGVFLIWVGSGLDLGALAANPWPVLGGAAMIITLKGSAIYALLRVRGAW